MDSTRTGRKGQGRTYDSRNYNVVARLRDGVTLEEADSELKTVQARVVQGYVNPVWQANASKIRMENFGPLNYVGDTKHAVLGLTVAAGLLWLIACINAINLLLAHASARQREIAMRGALGASRWRLIQQLVMEELALSSVAAVLGAGLAFVAVHLFHHLLQPHLPYGAPTTVSLHVLLAWAVLTLLSAVVSSASPAFLATRLLIEPTLRQGGQQSGTGRSQHRLRSGLVIAEIAMSLALLADCGHVPLGFRTDHILVASMEIPTYRFAKISATIAIYEPLLERIQHLPGVDAAGLMTTAPLEQHFRMELSIYKKKGESPTAVGSSIISRFKAVSPELQRVFGFQMLKGRYFNAGDTASSQPVIVVNRAFARAYAPDEEDPAKVIGKELISLAASGPGAKRATIVGVLDDFRQAAVGVPGVPEVQVTLPQIAPDSGFYKVLEGMWMELAVRTRRPPSQMIPELRRLVRSYL